MTATATRIPDQQPERGPDPAERRWYVARLKWRTEQRTASILSAKQIRVFLPQIRRPPRPVGRPASQLLFPGYAFLWVDLRSEEGLIARSSPGVQYLLGHQGAPAVVPDDLVEAIRRRAELEDSQRGPAGFRAGESVRVLAPHLRDVEAIFDRSLNAAGRVRVFIEILGRRVPVEVSAWQLARA